MVIPEQDPQFLAFQRAMGFQNNELGAMTQLRNDQLMQSYQLRVPGYEDTAAMEKQNLSDSAAARGVSTSGVEAQRQKDAQQRTTDRQMADFGGTVLGQQMNDADLIRQIAENNRQQQEQALQGANRAAVGSAQTILNPYISGI